MWRAFDFSNLDVATLNPANVHALQAAPYYMQAAIVATQYPTSRAYIAGLLKDAGTPIAAAYEEIYWDRMAADRENETAIMRDRIRAGCTVMGCEWVYLVCENTGSVPSSQTVAETVIDGLVDALRAVGLNVGLWTNNGFWAQYLGNSTRYADGLPFIKSDYGPGPGLAEPDSSMDYAGKTTCVGHQVGVWKGAGGRPEGRDFDYLFDPACFSNLTPVVVPIPPVPDEPFAHAVNASLQERFSLALLAWGDYDKMMTAYNTLKAAGLV